MNYTQFAGTPLLNMVLWCVLRIYNDGDVEEEEEDSRHGQEGLDPRDNVVSEILLH